MDTKRMTRHSGQKFKFEVPYKIEILKLINKGINDAKDIQTELCIGKNKIEVLIEWLKIANLIKDESCAPIELTLLGEAIIKLENNMDFTYPLIYSKLCSGKEYGGHFYFSRMVNNVLCDIAFSYNNTITSDEAKENMLNYKDEVGNVTSDDILSLSRMALTGLSNFDTGFGKMGIVSEVENNKFAVSYYDPHELVCAYIIYDRLKEGQTAVPFKDVISGDYHLGRLFYLTEDDIFDIFARLRDRNIIGMEITGGLNQLTINPKLSKGDILEEMIKVG